MVLSLLLLPQVQAIMAQPEEIYLQIPAGADAYVAEDKSNWKAGLEDYLIIGFSEYFSQYDCKLAPYPSGYYQKRVICTQEYRVEDRRNILVHFDLSPIPPGSEVTEAILQLHVYSPKDSLPVIVYGLEECFKEDEVTWINRNTAHMWKSSGGTHEDTKLDSGVLGKFQKSTGFYRFNVTDYYRRVVKGEVDNCGIIIAPDPRRYPGPREETVDICSLQTGECQTIVREGFKRYILNERTAGYYAKFYSKELAIKDNLSDYIPTLMIKFKGPSIHLISNQTTFKAYAGEEFSFNLVPNGTYLGNLSLTPEAGEGIDVRLEGPAVMGSPVKVVVSVAEGVEPGEYPIRIVPEVEGYNISFFDIKEFSGTITVEKKTVEPTDYFLMLPQDNKVTVPQGGEALLKLSLVPRGKFWAKVRLSSSSPEWMNVTFDPEEGVPSFSSVISVRVNEGAPLGTHDLILIGEGGGYSTNVTIKVNVVKGQTTQPTTRTTRTTSTTSSVKTETSSPRSQSSTPPTTVRETSTTVGEGEGINPSLLLALAVVIVVAGAGVLLFLRRRSS